MIIFLGILLFPFKTTIVPAWNLRVVDQTGSPISAIKVTEHWQHYLLESDGHEEIRLTAADGTVSFPDRSIRAGLLRRFLATIGRIAQDGRRAKREPYASVVVWGSKGHATEVAVYDPRQAHLSQIVVHSFR